MVRNTGTTPDTRRIRRLKTPIALVVEASKDGVPLRLKLRGVGVWQDVRLVRRPWRINQLWWRPSGEGVRRDYFRVEPEDGPPLTLYHDAVNDEWYRQEYG